MGVSRQLGQDLVLERNCRPTWSKYAVRFGSSTVGGEDAPEPERQPLRSRRTPFASDRTPSASGSALHTDPKLAPCPSTAAACSNATQQPELLDQALLESDRATIINETFELRLPAQPRQPPPTTCSARAEMDPSELLSQLKTLSCAWLPRSIRGSASAMQPRDKWPVGSVALRRCIAHKRSSRMRLREHYVSLNIRIAFPHFQL